jgi:hypothetical protein
MKLISILEHYDNEESCTLLVNYDLLPKKVKKAVDRALADDDETTEVDAYKEGLQFLPNKHISVIDKGSQFTNVESFYYVTFYDA